MGECEMGNQNKEAASLNFGNNPTQVRTRKACRELTFATFKRNMPHDADHRMLTVGAIHLVLNLAIREPTKQDAAMLRVFIRNRFLFKLTAKLTNLVFQLLIFSFKPIIFLFESLTLLSQLDDSFLENRCASVLSNEPFDSSQQFREQGVASTTGS